VYITFSMKGNSPFFKKMILLLFSIALLTVFFLLPRNRIWLTSQVARYWTEAAVQKNKLNEEHRMRVRFGNYYILSKKIAELLDSTGNKKNVLILVPSTTYFKERGITYHVPEPAVFYYFTGLKTTWPDNHDAETATWYVTANQGNIFIENVASQLHFADTLALFRKYNSVL
jgi:hypothetical protein